MVLSNWRQVLEYERVSVNSEFPINKQEATRLLKSGYGDTLLNVAASYVAPLSFECPEDKVTRNGSIFFADCGKGPFAITAAHVLNFPKQWEDEGKTVICKIGNIVFEPHKRLIAVHNEIDIATFEISVQEILTVFPSENQKCFLSHKNWPPRPPDKGKGVFFAGFPEKEKINVDWPAINYGIISGIATATSINARDVMCQFEREDWVDIKGAGFPPEKYNFSGFSGAPLLTLVDHNGIISWRLAGVIYEGPRDNSDPLYSNIPGFEVLYARRSDFICADGHLIVGAWPKGFI
jgi:hypothetical protein